MFGCRSQLPLVTLFHHSSVFLLTTLCTTIIAKLFISSIPISSANHPKGVFLTFGCIFTIADNILKKPLDLLLFYRTSTNFDNISTQSTSLPCFAHLPGLGKSSLPNSLSSRVSFDEMSRQCRVLLQNN